MQQADGQIADVIGVFEQFRTQLAEVEQVRVDAQCIAQPWQHGGVEPVDIVRQPLQQSLELVSEHRDHQ